MITPDTPDLDEATELPEMTRGKGVRLQKYKDGGISDARIFNAKDGLSWTDTSGRVFVKQMSELQSGVGMHGGPGNPLGARALYLWKDNRDTLFRIHGTFEPWTIGKSVSSGCIRMINQDAMDLYGQIDVGTKVVVLSPAKRPRRNNAAERST